VLASRSTSLTRGQVGKVLGPTYAGSTAKLTYPGIAFDLEGNGGRDDVVRKVSVMPRSGEVKPLSPVISCDISVNSRYPSTSLKLTCSLEEVLRCICPTH